MTFEFNPTLDMDFYRGRAEASVIGSFPKISRQNGGQN
jgi:hypothetical protein